MPGDDALPARVRAALEQDPVSAPATPASAVLVPVVPDDGGWSVLFTRRSARLRDHPGEVSFPGGRIDATDATALACATRETEEEIGLPVAAVSPLGHLPVYRTFRGSDVWAFAGAVDPDAKLVPTQSWEVDEVLRVPLADLVAGRGPGTTRVDARPGATVAHELGVPYRVSCYDGRCLSWGPRGDRVVHYWNLAPRTTIWGITGEILARFLRTALGWSPPVEPKMVHAVDELFP